MKKRGTRADGTRSDAGLHRTSIFHFDPDDLVIIGLDTKDGPEHRLYDERINDPITDQEIANIRTFGVRVPVLVQRDGNRWLVVDGRGRVRRARAAKQLQRKAGEEVLKVACVPQRGDDAMIFGVSRVANSCRTEDSPLRNAKNAQRMIDMGKTQEEVAIAFGKSQSTVSTWLALLDLSPKVKAAVDSGKIAASAAAKLGKLSRKEQEESLGSLISNGHKPSAGDAKNAVRVRNGQAPVVTARGRIVQAVMVLAEVAAKRDELTRAELLDRFDQLSKAVTDKALAEHVA